MALSELNAGVEGLFGDDFANISELRVQSRSTEGIAPHRPGDDWFEPWTEDSTSVEFFQEIEMDDSGTYVEFLGRAED